jgi:hypothetical protein
MIKEAIEKIQEMTQAFTYNLEGRQYTSKAVHPLLPPGPAALDLATLTGLLDYINQNVDGIDLKKTIIHVYDYKTVCFLSDLKAPWANRECYARATNEVLKFPFGQFMAVEDFVIRLQSQFVQDETTAAILKVVGNISDSQIRQFADDGVTQQATTKAGVSRVENVPVPNPVTLRPYRTFLEVEQPESKFVFRMKSGNETPSCALFEADGGVWKGVAVLLVKNWLSDPERLSGMNIIA